MIIRTLYFCLALQTMFNFPLLAKNNININIGAGQYMCNNCGNLFTDTKDNLGINVALNPFYKIKYLDSLYLDINIGRWQNHNVLIKYRFYSVGLAYNVIDSSFLTLYIGYDIFNNYVLDTLETTVDGHQTITTSSYKAYGFKVGGDLRIYNAFFIFLDYKVNNLKDERNTKLNTYLLGIKYKFNVINIKKIKSI